VKQSFYIREFLSYSLGDVGATPFLSFVCVYKGVSVKFS
jgi:hypothetical protein